MVATETRTYRLDGVLAIPEGVDYLAVERAVNQALEAAVASLGGAVEGVFVEEEGPEDWGGEDMSCES